jgi:hypothetical protein
VWRSGWPESIICSFNVFPSFEQLSTKTLGFVDDQDDPSMRFGFLDQKLREQVVCLNRVESLLA